MPTQPKKRGRRLRLTGAEVALELCAQLEGRRIAWATARRCPNRRLGWTITVPRCPFCDDKHKHRSVGGVRAVGGLRPSPCYRGRSYVLLVKE